MQRQNNIPVYMYSHKITPPFMLNAGAKKLQSIRIKEKAVCVFPFI